MTGNPALPEPGSASAAQPDPAARPPEEDVTALSWGRVSSFDEQAESNPAQTTITHARLTDLLDARLHTTTSGSFAPTLYRPGGDDRCPEFYGGVPASSNHQDPRHVAVVDSFMSTAAAANTPIGCNKPEAGKVTIPKGRVMYFDIAGGGGAGGDGYSSWSIDYKGGWGDLGGRGWQVKGHLASQAGSYEIAYTVGKGGRLGNTAYNAPGAGGTGFKGGGNGGNGGNSTGEPGAGVVAPPGSPARHRRSLSSPVVAAAPRFRVVPGVVAVAARNHRAVWSSTPPTPRVEVPKGTLVLAVTTAATPVEVQAALAVTVGTAG